MLPREKLLLQILCLLDILSKKCEYCQISQIFWFISKCIRCIQTKILVSKFEFTKKSQFTAQSQGPNAGTIGDEWCSKLVCQYWGWNQESFYMLNLHGGEFVSLKYGLLACKYWFYLDILFNFLPPPPFHRPHNLGLDLLPLNDFNLNVRNEKT